MDILRFDFLFNTWVYKNKDIFFHFEWGKWVLKALIVRFLFVLQSFRSFTKTRQTWQSGSYDSAR